MLHQASIAFDGSYEEFTKSDNPVAAEYLRAMPVLQSRDLEFTPRRRQGSSL